MFFWAQSYLSLLLQNTFFRIDGSVPKNYANWDKISRLILYIFLSFWGKERRKKQIFRTQDNEQQQLTSSKDVKQEVFESGQQVINWLSDESKPSWLEP